MKFFDKKTNNSKRSVGYSRPHKVFSYYASRSAGSDQDSKLNSRLSNGNAATAAKKRSLRLHRFTHGFLAVVLLAGGFYLLSIDAKPRISVLSINGQSTLFQDRSIYENEATRLLKSSFLNKFKPTINTSLLASGLKAEFPELSEVSVIVPLTARQTVFEIKPSLPTFIIVSKGAISFVVDEKGRAVVELARVSDKKSLDKLPLIRDDSGLEMSVGESVLPKEGVDFIKELIYQLESRGQKITEMSLPQVANELHVAVANQPYFVKFNMTADARAQAGAFLAVRQQLELEGRAPLEYIDVRVEEKAYYR